MLKIKYHKNAYLHDKVKAVKKSLIKAYKLVDKLSYIFAEIELTGVQEIDFRNIRFYLKKEYRNFQNNIILENNDKETIDFDPIGSIDSITSNIDKNLTILQFVNILKNTLDIIGEYPAIDEKMVEYKFLNTNIEAMYLEVQNYFDQNPILGFNQRWFAVTTENSTKELYSLFFSKDDLLNVQKIIVKYHPLCN